MITDCMELISLTDAREWADQISDGSEGVDSEVLARWIWENVPHQTSYGDEAVQSLLVREDLFEIANCYTDKHDA